MDYSEQIFAFMVSKEVTKRVVGELGRGESTEDQMNERIAFHTESVLKGVRGTFNLIREVQERG